LNDTKQYLENTRKAFDSAAGTFDADDSSNGILLWMRACVHRLYLNSFSAGSRLLELNAGTGIDAVFLAEKGINVYATDISPNMINVLAEKVRMLGLNKQIQYEVKSFDSINTITQSDFDGVISNFGGLNCIPDFSQLSIDIHTRLKPGGRIIAAVINKICPWEIFYYMLKLDFKTAFRRFKKQGIDANLNGEKIRTFYFTPGGFGKFFSHGFKIKKIYSHGLLTPPPYLVGFYNKLKPLIRLLMKTDELIKGIYPFNRLGDHFIIVLEKPTESKN
jgi:ubiquinone/menaquinone biosynthesis C-methylase UbiE